MNTNHLLPNRYKRIGWILFIPSFILGILYLLFELEFSFLDCKVFSLATQAMMGENEFFTFIVNNILDEIIGIAIILGAICIVFSKEKIEDEFISSLRLTSLVWATYINYAVLIFSILFIYDIAFFWVLVFNMFTILFFFIIHFNWSLRKAKNNNLDEE